MKVRYHGHNFVSVRDGHVYECLRVDGDCLIIRDEDPPEEEDEGYYYRAVKPILSPHPEGYDGGWWDIVEDDEEGTLTKLFQRLHLID